MFAFSGESQVEIFEYNTKTVTLPLKLGKFTICLKKKPITIIDGTH